MNPEDLMAAPTAEEILKAPEYGPDGQEKKEYARRLSATTERLATKQSGANNLIQSKSDDLFGPPSQSNPRDELATQEESNLPSGIRESAEALRSYSSRAAATALSSEVRRAATFWILSASAAKPLSKEQMQEHKKFMDEYRAVVDPSWRPPAAALQAIRSPWSPMRRRRPGSRRRACRPRVCRARLQARPRARGSRPTGCCQSHARSAGAAGRERAGARANEADAGIAEG